MLPSTRTLPSAAAQQQQRLSAARPVCVPVRLPRHTLRVSQAPSTGNARPSLAPARASSSSEFDVDGKQPGPRDTSLGPREDDVLPESLPDALRQAAQATADAIMRDNSRCQVEILLTEFWDPISGPIFPNRGDQERFWKITRRFVEELSTALKTPVVNAVYPDAGVAAMLSYQWKEDGIPFRITSLTDRLPVSKEDEVIVVACPDPQGADECIRLVRAAGEQDEREGRPYRPIVLFNPRLSSGDVGLGLNARRLRDSFMKNFVVTYSLRPIADIGSVYRRYPGLWKVFLEEENLPGRYRMIAEVPSRPAGEGLDYMIREATTPGATIGPDGQPQAPSFLNQVQTVMASLNYFMRSLSK